MSFEDFDKKVRDAADHHHPSYDENAWMKMEKLLDKHLPGEKKRRRRAFFWLFVFLGLVVAGGVITWQPWKSAATLSHTVPAGNKQPAAAPGQPATGHTTSINPGNDTGNDAGEQPSLTSAGAAEKTITGTDHTPPAPGTVHGEQPAGNRKSPGDAVAESSGKPFAASPANSRPPVITAHRQQENMQVTVANAATSKRKKENKQKENKDPAGTRLPVAGTPGRQTVITSPSSPVTGHDTLPVTLPATAGGSPAAARHEPAENNIATDSMAVTGKLKDPDSAVTGTPPPATDKPAGNRKEKQNGLWLTLSGGPDISVVGFDNTGELRPVLGAGLAYTFADRFTVRTGFYTARKVYSAPPTDYKFASPPPNIDHLKRIDADCRVYEIPLTLAYRFAGRNRSSWFGAAGVSTYLMKKESYDYRYEYAGISYSYNRLLENENKHIFSVLSLSAGYSRKLGSRFFVAAEPYLKMPLNGVGFGKVKLNSGGVLFTLGARLTGSK